MHKLLIIDDEAPMRRLLRINLEDRYKIVDTGDPELALQEVLQSKPNAILLDLRMPNYSGFELCRTLKSITSTQLIPIIIVTGEAGASTKTFCEELGATAYFEKPVDFEALRDRLASVLEAARPERRSEVRISLRAKVSLQGTDTNGQPFEEQCVTENISRSAFFCACGAELEERSEVAVSLISGGTKFVGMALVVRRDNSDVAHTRYAFRFVNKDVNWILQ
jgi:DNA-binding response OmpR family regulator